MQKARFANSVYFKIMAFVMMASVMFIAGCDKLGNGTTGGYTVTFNLTAPSWYNGGNLTAAGLYSAIDNSAAVKYGQVNLSGNKTATITMNNVPEGTYVVFATIDADQSGFSANGQPKVGNMFWGGLNVSITGDKVITVTQYHWQYYSTNSILLEITGIPAGNEGRPMGAGIFEDGTDVLGNLNNIQPLMGGNGIVYNGAAIIAANPNGGPNDSTFNSYQLPAGTYDFWMIVDADGTPAQWNDSTGHGVDASTGDYIDSLNFVYTNNSSWRQIAGTFDQLTAMTATINVTLPAGLNITGNQIGAVLYNNWNDTLPVVESITTITGATTALTFNFFTEKNYQIAVIVDVTGNGINFAENTVQSGDLIWGALDVPTTDNLVIDVPAEAMQEYRNFIFGLGGIPSGHDGQIVAVGLYYNNQEPLSQWSQRLLSGKGYIYNNSALIALRADDNSADTLNIDYVNGTDYDVWSLIDVDGIYSDYQDSLHNPITVGDYISKFDFHCLSNLNNNFVLTTGSYSPLVSISGTVSCPAYTTGDIYLFLMRTNPLVNQNSPEVTNTVLTAPGAFTMPFYSNDSILVVGFWDADGTGGLNGPTQNDVIGAYGVTPGDTLLPMQYIHTTDVNSSGKDFELWLAYDSTAFMP